MKKHYLISLTTDSEESEKKVTMTSRQLDSDQYHLLNGIFKELDMDEKSINFKISEIPIRVLDKVRVTGRGNILVCSNADCLEIGQRIKADFLDTIFEVTALEYVTPRTQHTGVVLRPNEIVSEIPFGAVLEVLSE